MKTKKSKEKKPKPRIFLKFNNYLADEWCFLSGKLGDAGILAFFVDGHFVCEDEALNRGFTMAPEDFTALQRFIYFGMTCKERHDADDKEKLEKEQTAITKLLKENGYTIEQARAIPTNRIAADAF